MCSNVCCGAVWGRICDHSFRGGYGLPSPSYNAEILLDAADAHSYSNSLIFGAKHISASASVVYRAVPMFQSCKMTGLRFIDLLQACQVALNRTFQTNSDGTEA
jgi:hypothetical protein